MNMNDEVIQDGSVHFCGGMGLSLMKFEESLI